MAAALPSLQNISTDMRRVGILFPALLCVLFLCACIGELDTKSRVHDLRILAIQATPPERYIQEGNLSFQLDVLAPLGSGYGVLNYRVSTCPDPDQGRCEGRDGELVLGTGSYSGDTFTLGFSFGLEHLDLLKAAIEADPWHGFGGLPLTISVKIWQEGREDFPEFAYKQIVLQIPGLSLEGEPPNENPPPPILTDADGGIFDLDAAIEIEGDSLKIDVDPADRDARPKYNVPTYSGGTLSLDESWTYEWFTTRGSFNPESTGGINPVSGLPMTSVTEIFLDSGEEPGGFTAWCVLRDGRGGTSWRRFTGIFKPAAEQEQK